MLNSFLDALGIQETNLAVHEPGGPVGLHWAIQNPGRVPKLITLNTLVYPETSWAVKLFLIAMKRSSTQRPPVASSALSSPIRAPNRVMLALTSTSWNTARAFVLSIRPGPLTAPGLTEGTKP